MLPQLDGVVSWYVVPNHLSLFFSFHPLLDNLKSALICVYTFVLLYAINAGVGSLDNIDVSAIVGTLSLL